MHWHYTQQEYDKHMSHVCICLEMALFLHPFEAKHEWKNLFKMINNLIETENMKDIPAITY